MVTYGIPFVDGTWYRALHLGCSIYLYNERQATNAFDGVDVFRFEFSVLLNRRNQEVVNKITRKLMIGSKPDVEQRWICVFVQTWVSAYRNMIMISTFHPIGVVDDENEDRLLQGFETLGTVDSDISQAYCKLATF